MKHLSRLVLCSAALIGAVAMPASALEVKVNCSDATAITYQPRTGTNDVTLFRLSPEVVGAHCIAGKTDQHLLRIGTAEPLTFKSVEQMKSFLGALGTFVDEHTKKKTASQSR